MATYIPNATQTTEPVESRTVESAALEFRTLKGSINTRIDEVQANLDAEEAARIAEDTALSWRIDGLEGAYESVGSGGLPGTSYVSRYSGNGVTTAFTLDVAVPTNAVVNVYVNGIYQHKNTFTTSGALLTFSEAPPAGNGNIEVVYYVPLTMLDQLSSASVSYTPAGTGAVDTSVQAKLRLRSHAIDIGITTGDCVANLQGIVPVNGAEFVANGFYPGANYGGGRFVFEASRPKSQHNGGTIVSPTVTWSRTPAELSDFLNATTESDPSGLGCWVRYHGDEVYVSWFGAVGDAVRPTSMVPDGAVTGTNDTLAVSKCRDYIQTVAFQPNLFVGFWGGFRLCFEPNRAYYLVGNNPLGSSRPRSVTTDDAGALARQSWVIDGKGALIVWEVENENDCLIEAFETFTTQLYTNFSVIVAKAVGSMGIFFSNVANPLRNATQRHKFDRVEVFHAMPSSETHGLKYMFRYLGDNLGDRLITEQCSFNQAHTMFYSENGEAVQQGFKSTTFASYLTGGVFFHLRRHGSTFNFSSGCGMLIKGNNQILVKTEYLPSAETGSNGANTYMDFKGTRLEFAGGKTQTIANCDFGCLEIDGITMSPGGLPAITSPILVSRKTAVVRVRNSHLYGRIVVGLDSSANVNVKRAYTIRLENCQFSMDVGQNLFVEEPDGSLTSWRTAIVGAYQVPAVVIDGTDTRTAAWQGLTADTKSYVFDGLYHCNLEYNTIPWVCKLVIGRYRTSSQRFYLDNRDYVVLPPYITITSIKITHVAIANATMDTLRVKVGAAQFDYALPNNTARRQFEILPAGQVVVVSDNTPAERIIASECRVGGNVWESPSFIAFLEIEWRPAYGLNELTTTESAGVRLTRLA